MVIVDVQAIPIKIAEAEFWGGQGTEVRRAVPVDSDYVVQPGWLGLYSSKIETCLVRIETDTGQIRFGEGQSPIGPEVTAAAVERVFCPILTEGKAIAELAEAYNFPVTMHTGMASAVLTAASLHLRASIPDCRYQEYQPMIHAVANRFIRSPLVCDQGRYDIPAGPGLGIEIDEAAIRANRV